MHEPAAHPQRDARPGAAGRRRRPGGACRRCCARRCSSAADPDRPARRGRPALGRARTTRPGSSTGCSPTRWACRWSTPRDLLVTTTACSCVERGRRGRGRRRSTCGSTRATLLHSDGRRPRPLGRSLLHAVRAGASRWLNALGNGVADDKAVYAYVPRDDRLLPGRGAAAGATCPTYLCGDAEPRAEVLDRLDELVLKPVDGYGGTGSSSARTPSRRSWTRRARRSWPRPAGWIAQETVRLSTHPIFDGERLAPRARRPAGLRALPAAASTDVEVRPRR